MAEARVDMMKTNTCDVESWTVFVLRFTFAKPCDGVAERRVVNRAVRPE